MKSAKWDDGEGVYGFNAMPVGLYRGIYNSRIGWGQEALYWSSESLGVSIQIERDSVHVGRDYMEEGDLYTVRCVKGLPKCGSLEYNHDTHYCTKEKRVEEQPMCGSAKFNPEKSFCYSDGKIYSKCGDGNGELVEYNPKNEFCGEKNEVVEYGYCDNRSYNPEQYYCDSQKRVHILSKCGSEKNAIKYNSEKQFCDTRDNRVYKYVTIGEGATAQIWMAENLNYEMELSYCYDNNAENCTQYGRLYTWAAAMDSAGTSSTIRKGCGYETTCSPTYPVRGACPSGWHLPAEEEFVQLIDNVAVGGTDAGLLLKSSHGWADANGNSGDGTDDYGFSALPAGVRISTGKYETQDRGTYFWSSSVENIYNARVMFLKSENAVAGRAFASKSDAYSVRCIKN